MVFASLYRAFPDLQTTVEDLIAEGDKVVERDTVIETHQGEYMGLPPTGRVVAYNDIFVMQVVNGRIAEIWEASTSLEMNSPHASPPGEARFTRHQHGPVRRSCA